MADPEPTFPAPRPPWRDVLAIGSSLTIALLVVGGLLGYLSAERLSRHYAQTRHTHEVIVALETLLSTLKDAETGQRGYLLTGEDSYLAPYEDSRQQLSSQLETLRTLVAEDAGQVGRMAELESQTNAKLQELARTVELARAGNRDGALDVVRSDAGKLLMDQFRQSISMMQEAERAVRQERVLEAQRSFRTVVWCILVTAGTGILLTAVVSQLTRRNLRLRERSAQVLAEQRERLRTTLASIGDGVLTTDAKGRVTFLNPVAEALTGWSHDDALGQPLEKVFRIVNEETRQEVPNPAVRALREGVIVGLANHTVLIGRDGRERPIDDSAAPIRLGTRISGAVLVFRDVEVRRKHDLEVEQAHSFLESSLDALSAHVAVLDEKGVIQLVNAAWRKFAADNGGTNDSFGVGANYLDACERGVCVEGNDASAGIREVLGGRVPSFELEYPCHAPHESRWFVMRVTRFSGSDGPRVVVAHENVTERKLAETAATERARLAQLRADVAAALARTQLLPDSLQAVTDALRQHLDVALARIWTRAVEEDLLELQASSGLPLAADHPLNRIRVGDYLIGAVAQSGVSRISNQLDKEPAVQDPAWIEREQLLGFAGFPLQVEGRSVGALALFSRNKLPESWLVDLAPLVDQIAEHIERKRAEEGLSRSEEMFRTLAESIPQLCWMADPDGNAFWFNRRFYEFAGTTAAQLASWDRRVMHDPDMLPVVLERWQHSLRTGEPFDMVFPLKGKDGEFRQFLTRVVPLRNEQGKVVRWFGTNTDVSEVKRIERELHEARSRLESTLAAGEIGTWEFDLVHNRVQVDANLQRMLGVDRDVAAGAPQEAFLAAIHPDDRERVLAELAKSVNTGTNFSGEYRLLGLDGQPRWVSARGRVEKDATGQSVRLPGVVVDINSQRQIEEQLRESESRFRQIADTMPQIVWVTRPDGHVEYYNRRWYEFTGVAHGSTDGDQWAPLFHPEDQARTWDRWQLSLKTGELYEIEYRLRRHDGAYRWFLGRALPVRDEVGNIVKWFGTCTDIEDYKQVEAERQKFVWLAENSTDFIGMCEVDAVPFYINQAGLEIVGLESLEQAQNVNVREFFFPEDQFRVVDEFFPQVLRNGSGEIEVRFRHFQTGAAVWMLYRVFAITSSRSARVILATVSRDITQRRRLEDELRRLAADLSDANHRKDEFLATLAHELRNPLAPIRTGLEVMKLSGNDPATVEEIRGTMERQTQQMVRLIDDLLDVSRITQGKLELRRCRVSLSDVLRSAVEAVRPFVDEAGHVLSVHLPEEPVHMHADPNRLAQVISNLLHNSSKYTPDGGRIELATEREGTDAIITVRDNGIGIPTEMQEHIFDMFTQIDRPLEKGYQGLGIGLTLVKRLVEMHGGTISVSSAGANQGSEFHVRLPVETLQNAASPASAAPVPAPPPRRLKVLVVDDNTAAADMLALVVRMLGHDVSTAYDGQQGVEAAQERRPDVILMDIGMPRLNGYEAARHIRQQVWGQAIRLVALTGWGQDEDKQRARDAGFDKHLVKPAEPAELQRLLAEAAAAGSAGGVEPGSPTA